MMRFINECDWEWNEWDETLVKVVLEHADVRAFEVRVEDMDYEEISIRVVETERANGKHMENRYIIRYFEDTAIRGCFMFAYFFYRVEGADMTMLDNGAYQIRKVNGKLKSMRLVE